MKKSILSLAVILALAISAQARSITTGVLPNITRNAGQTIPLTFNCSGFAGQTVDFYLVNAHTWQRIAIEYSLPVANGVNNHALVIPWDWIDVGPYVVDIVSGTAHCQSSRIITIRSAIIWPYAGTVYPKNSQVAVVWSTANVDADFLTVSLFNFDTGIIYGVDLDTDPLAGQVSFNTPINVSGNHFVVCLNAYVWVESTPEQIEMGEDAFYPEPVASTQSAVVAIH